MRKWNRNLIKFFCLYFLIIIGDAQGARVIRTTVALDEDTTEKQSTCSPYLAPYRLQCDDGECIEVNRKCDGINDCSDGSDEINCATTASTTSCSHKQFECHTTKICIPQGWVCDGDADCGDSSDEDPIKYIVDDHHHHHHHSPHLHDHHHHPHSPNEHCHEHDHIKQENQKIPSLPISTKLQSKNQNRVYALHTIPEPKYKLDGPVKTERTECEGSYNGERAPSQHCNPDDFNERLPFHHPGEPMGAIGPWASGRVDWSPLAGLTGTRPVVDRYSITRFSTDEWKMRNQNLVAKANDSMIRSMKTENDGKNVMARTFSITDQAQEDNTKRLTNRTCDINICKGTLERAIGAQVDEISLLEGERNRLKRSIAAIGLPERIAKECLDRRCGRSDTELVRDVPEEELVKEIALIGEIKTILEKTLRNVEEQQIENRSARQRLEFDWSDKKDASEIDAINAGLNSKSSTILFKHGATRFMNEQSTERYWKHFTEQNLEECENTRQKSILLRQTLNAILMNAARDLRTQADAVEKALQDRVAATDEIREKLENDLTTVLLRLAETEKLITKLTDGMKSLDNCMKTAQTRLDNRNRYRENVENCRDRPNVALVEEVKTVQDGISAMAASIQEAENTKRHLMDTRNELEREVRLKRRSIMIDQERCLLLRTHFPPVTALSGN